MNLEEAETMIRRALQSEPNNASYLDSLGWVEFRKGQFDRALDDLLRLRRLQSAKIRSCLNTSATLI